jgi:hypothetical protein
MIGIFFPTTQGEEGQDYEGTKRLLSRLEEVKGMERMQRNGA